MQQNKILIMKSVLSILHEMNFLNFDWSREDINPISTLVEKFIGIYETKELIGILTISRN